jgi:hypothetical protein
MVARAGASRHDRPLSFCVSREHMVLLTGFYFWTAETVSLTCIRLNAEYLNARCYHIKIFFIVHVHMLDIQWPVHFSCDLSTENCMSVTQFNGNFTQVTIKEIQIIALFLYQCVHFACLASSNFYPTYVCA